VPLRVGVGIDAGEAVAVAGGYRGGALNLAARLCSIAGPGEVLVSEGVVHLARHVDEMSYVDRGRVKLKGMDEPVHVMELSFDLDMPEVASVAGRRWTRERLAALAAGIIMVVALVVVAAMRIGGGHAPVSLATNVVGFADASGRILGQVPLGGRPGGVAVGASSVWATDTEHDSVVQINAAGRKVDTIPVGLDPTGVAVGGGGVWVADSGSGTVSWVSASSPGQSTPIPVGQGPGAIAFGMGFAWVVNATDGTLQRIDA
jgi:DNA-binding beta-propeller fold protein YncE